MHEEIIAGFVRARQALTVPGFLGFFFPSRGSHHKRLLRQSTTCWERRLGDKKLNITSIDPQHSTRYDADTGPAVTDTAKPPSDGLPNNLDLAPGCRDGKIKYNIYIIGIPVV